MFYSISGKCTILTSNSLVIENNGIGYLINVSGNTIKQINSSKENQLLYTHFAVRDDSADLYGFISLDELRIFKLLISVSGVGAKSALSILSLFSPENFAIAISNKDSASIAKAIGIGPKTAARIVLELKDKISLEDYNLSNNDIPKDNIDNTNLSEDALNALLVLGYTRNDAIKAIKSSQKTDVEAIIKDALKFLSK